MRNEIAPEYRQPTEREKRLRIAVPVTQEAINRGIAEWMNAPKQASDASRDRMYGNGMIQKLLGFHAQVAGPADAAYKRLAPYFTRTGDGTAIDRIEEIRDRLRMRPPRYGEPLEDEHAYLTYAEEAPLATDPANPSPDPLHRYRVNNKAVLADIELLASLRESVGSANPGEQQALDSMIDYLNAYRLLDPRIAMEEEMYRTEGGRSAMDVGGKEMGRVALTGVLATATAIFGTLGIVQFFREGKISVAPFLWAFATWFVADPKLVTSFFDKDDPIKKEFAGLHRLTGNKRLQELSDLYGIGGPGWAKTVQRIYDGDHENLHTVETPDDASKARVARTLAGGNVGIERTLRSMMDTSPDPLNHRTDFALFVENMLSAASDESQTFMITYVKEDSFREGLRRDPQARRDIDAMIKARRELGN